MKKIVLLLCSTFLVQFSHAQTKTYVPDNNFEQTLITLGLDNVLDDSVLTQSIDTLKTLSVSVKNIASLKGIEDFKSLRVLLADRNQLTSLDVTKNTALVELRFRENQISSIDVSKNIALTQLWCSSNLLSSLNVSQNTLLTDLDCAGNKLNGLSVSNNTKLTQLFCNNNSISSLELSQNVALNRLDCYSNQIGSLNVSTNKLLRYLLANSNALTSLDFRGATNLPFAKTLDVRSNPLLTCISVDDTTVAKNAGSWQKDASAKYRLNCNPTRNALNFDGLNDYVSLGNTMNDVFAGAGKKFTIEAWIRPESHASAADNGRIFFAKYGNSACTQDARQFSMSFLNDGKLNFVAYGSTGTTVYRGVKGSTTIALNTWNHVVVTYDGSITTSNALDRIKLYVNGTLESATLHLTSGTYPFNIPTSNAHLGIGSSLSTTGAVCSQSTQRFDGDIDELRIWNTVRTCTEIVSNKDCKLSGTESGLVAYYDFDLGKADSTNSSTNVLVDIAGADQNGTLTNFALTGKTSNWVNGESNGVASSVCNTVIPSNCVPIITSSEDEDLNETNTIYPNPTSDKLFVSKKSENTAYTIFNSLGDELEKGTISGNSINVSQLDNGVYYLQLSGNGTTSRNKFIKQ